MDTDESLERSDEPSIVLKKTRDPRAVIGTLSRRDFVNGVAATLAASSTAVGINAQDRSTQGRLLSEEAWNGRGGVGDYAESNGNVWATVNAAHNAIRDDASHRQINRAFSQPVDETVDALVVGSGMSGLTAAYQLQRHAANARILVLDNHPMFGGESKQNEFMVDGVRLYAPQGASGFSIETTTDTPEGKLYRDIGLPDRTRYESPTGTRGSLEFDRSNFGYIFKSDVSQSWGWFFDASAETPAHWVRNIWADNLASTPFSAADRAELMRWRTTTEKPYSGSALKPWLDGMSYREYLVNELKLPETVLSYINPVIGIDVAAGAEMSALAAYTSGYPGFIGLDGTDNSQRRYADLPPGARDAFPGGNSGIARHLLKAMLPSAIDGGSTLDDIIADRVRLDRMDEKGSRLRIRQRSTVVAIRQAAAGNSSVDVIYQRGTRLFHVRAKVAVMGSASWVNKHICRDLPASYADAMAQFTYTPVLVANVALRNWRFMDTLGITACRWFSEGFGFCANIRTPMMVGASTPPLAPDKPVVMSFYVPFGKPGLPLEAQGPLGRAEMFATSYDEYVHKITAQMTKLFGMAGFDASRDIADIVLNRWGHAYSNPWPGFYHGRNGKPPARETLRTALGAVSFGHSELSGKQTWTHAVEEATRAAEQALARL